MDDCEILFVEYSPFNTNIGYPLWNTLCSCVDSRFEMKYLYRAYGIPIANTWYTLKEIPFVVCPIWNTLYVHSIPYVSYLLLYLIWNILICNTQYESYIKCPIYVNIVVLYVKLDIWYTSHEKPKFYEKPSYMKLQIWMIWSCKFFGKTYKN